MKQSAVALVSAVIHTTRLKEHAGRLQVCKNAWIQPDCAHRRRTRGRARHRRAAAPAAPRHLRAWRGRWRGGAWGRPPTAGPPSPSWLPATRRWPRAKRSQRRATSENLFVSPTMPLAPQGARGREAAAAGGGHGAPHLPPFRHCAVTKPCAPPTHPAPDLFDLSVTLLWTRRAGRRQRRERGVRLADQRRTGRGLSAAHGGPGERGGRGRAAAGGTPSARGADARG